MSPTTAFIIVCLTAAGLIYAYLNFTFITMMYIAVVIFAVSSLLNLFIELVGKGKDEDKDE